MSKNQIKEFVAKTSYKPKTGHLYYIGKDGNLYETTMGPKYKGYQAPMVAQLNIDREEGWLYIPCRNPEFEQKRDGTVTIPEGCVIEIWRYVHSIKRINNNFV